MADSNTLAQEGNIEMGLDVSKVRYISLIRLEGGESILNLPYASMTVDPDLIAGFVTAVIIFAKTPIRTIRKAAYDILIEVGETVLVLLVADPVADEKPYRKKLKQILELVEEKHGAKLEKFEGDVRRFREFALTILKEFPYDRPDISMVPFKKKGKTIPFRVGTTDKALEKIENFINGKRTVSEIMDLIDLSDDEVVALLSALEKYGWIGYKRRMSETDMLVTADCSDTALERIRSQYGPPVDDLLAAFENPTRIDEVLTALKYDKNALWFLLNMLTDANCLKMESH